MVYNALLHDQISELVLCTAAAVSSHCHFICPKCIPGVPGAPIFSWKGRRLGLGLHSTVYCISIVGQPHIMSVLGRHLNSFTTGLIGPTTVYKKWVETPT